MDQNDRGHLLRGADSVLLDTDEEEVLATTDQAWPVEATGPARTQRCCVAPLRADQRYRDGHPGHLREGEVGDEQREAKGAATRH